MLETHLSFPYTAAISSGGATMRIATLGNNIDVDTATQPEDVWSGADLGVLNGVDHRFIPKPTSPVSMEVVSSSANDTAAGAGARTVAIQYLDANYILKTTVIALAGLTPVALPEPVRRINQFVVATSGTVGDNNQGNLSVRLAGGLGATYSYMLIGHGLSRSSIYTVPDKVQFDLLSLVLSLNRTDTSDRWATFTVCVQSEAGRLLKGIELSASTSQPYRHESANVPLNVLAPRTDVWIRCEAVSANNTNVVGALFGVQRNFMSVSL